mmetsp:Transcript_70079/g.203154  ORF Transcript_70079/g.203154 Transcript_70079/m.203154 type:complete len:201 (+) Transcript_70079:1227-1829(+)
MRTLPQSTGAFREGCPMRHPPPAKRPRQRGLGSPAPWLQPPRCSRRPHRPRCHRQGARASGLRQRPPPRARGFAACGRQSACLQPPALRTAAAATAQRKAPPFQMGAHPQNTPAAEGHGGPRDPPPIAPVPPHPAAGPAPRASSPDPASAPPARHMRPWPGALGCGGRRCRQGARWKRGRMGRSTKPSERQHSRSGRKLQ